MSKQFKYVDGVKTNFKQNPLVGENEKVKAEDLNALADYFGTKVDNKLEYNVDFINSDELIDLLNEKQLVNVVWENSDYTIGIVKSLDPLIIEGLVGVANNNNQGNAVTLGNITLNKNSDVNLRTTADYMKEVNDAAVLGLNGVYRDLHSMNPYDATTIDDEFSIASVAFVLKLKDSITALLKDKVDVNLNNIDDDVLKAKAKAAGLVDTDQLDTKANKNLDNVANKDLKDKAIAAGIQESLNIPAGTDKLYFVKRLLDGSLGMQEFKGGLQLGGFEDVTSLVDETQLFDAVDLGGIYEVVVKKGNDNWYGLVICTNKDGNQAQLTGNFSFEDNIEHGAMIARTGINDALTYTSKTSPQSITDLTKLTTQDEVYQAVEIGKHYIIKDANSNYGVVYCSLKDATQASFSGIAYNAGNVFPAVLALSAGDNTAFAYSFNSMLVNEPVADNNPATKKYVDDATAAVKVDLPKTLTLVDNAGTIQDIKVGV